LNSTEHTFPGEITNSQELLRFRPHLAALGAAEAGDQRKVAGRQHRLTTSLQASHWQAIPGASKRARKIFGAFFVVSWSINLFCDMID